MIDWNHCRTTLDWNKLENNVVVHAGSVEFQSPICKVKGQVIDSELRSPHSAAVTLDYRMKHLQDQENQDLLFGSELHKPHSVAVTR